MTHRQPIGFVLKTGSNNCALVDVHDVARSDMHAPDVANYNAAGRSL